MLKNSKKKLRKLGAFSLVLAQVAAVGVVAPMTSASAFAGSAITRNMENLDRGVVATKTDDGVLIHGEDWQQSLLTLHLLFTETKKRLTKVRLQTLLTRQVL